MPVAIHSIFLWKKLARNTIHIFLLDHHTVPRYILTNTMDGIENPKDFSGIIWMCRQSLLGGECKFHHNGHQSDDFSRRDESITPRRADWRTNQGRCMETINENNLPYPYSGWKKTSCDAYIVHKHDFKHAAVKDRQCRMGTMFLVVKRILSQLGPRETWYSRDYWSSILPKIFRARRSPRWQTA